MPVLPGRLEFLEFFGFELSNRVVTALYNHLKEVWLMEGSWAVSIVADALIGVEVLHKVFQWDTLVRLIYILPWEIVKILNCFSCLGQSAINNMLELLLFLGGQSTTGEEIFVSLSYLLCIKLLI